MLWRQAFQEVLITKISICSTVLFTLSAFVDFQSNVHTGWHMQEDMVHQT